MWVKNMIPYIWDEISCEITLDPLALDAYGGWEFDCWLNAEVSQSLSDRGHVALVVIAGSAKQADMMFRRASPLYREMMGA